MFTGEPVKFTRWLENDLLGPVALEILQERSNELVKTNAAYRKEVAAHYRAELKKMFSFHLLTRCFPLVVLAQVTR
jgi:hypothetical protein